MDTDTKEKFNKINSHFDIINSRFDNLKDFLFKHFVTKQEFEDRIANLPTKQDFQSLVSSVDGYAKQVNDSNKETLILGEKSNRLESWAKVAGDKLGLNYKP